jgi:hypothetical protein
MMLLVIMATTRLTPDRGKGATAQGPRWAKPDERRKTVTDSPPMLCILFFLSAERPCVPAWRGIMSIRLSIFRQATVRPDESHILSHRRFSDPWLGGKKSP